ncbi:hypothetical protein BDR26DRAFT_848713 [Obelidium mucronatum]|nr:hypothetical protein BDR26DRAFT_848702 [Obelidium mucronatum]KAI9353516.1 hypothetical protein BDR26DRAFT_848713 [Obelidium mucronatum]
MPSATAHHNYDSTSTTSSSKTTLTNIKDKGLATFKALFQSGTQSSAGKWSGRTSVDNETKLQVVNSDNDSLQTVGIPVTLLNGSNQVGDPMLLAESDESDSEDDKGFDRLRNELLSGGSSYQYEQQEEPVEDVRSSLSDVATLKRAYSESVMGLRSSVDGDLPPRFGKKVVKEFMGYYLGICFICLCVVVGVLFGGQVSEVAKMMKHSYPCIKQKIGCSHQITIFSLSF